MVKEICKNCSHYSAYYKQRVVGYEKLSYGLCSIDKGERRKVETCDKFKTNELKLIRQKKLLCISLEQAANSINDIIHIIKETSAADE